jgi:hypothetical protein
MYTIKLLFRSPHKYCEVIPGDIQTIECLIEDLVSQVLLEIFQEIAVEDVTVIFSPGEEFQEQLRFRSF